MSAPAWFQKAMAQCESLALDVASDRERLWTRLWEHMPFSQIREAIEASLVTDDAIDPVGPVTKAVIDALEGK